MQQNNVIDLPLVLVFMGDNRKLFGLPEVKMEFKTFNEEKGRNLVGLKPWNVILWDYTLNSFCKKINNNKNKKAIILKIFG